MIRNKITKWEEDQARKLNDMPRREREKEAWRRLKRNLGKGAASEEVTLKIDGRETRNNKEIEAEIERF